ncbi:hypothetical protein JMJ35_004866 [Cladonia borealis]|uniref:Ketosynthase family 3 (KS3) domain-containing protein n=1 Tax=Cladonia borealis TaxID=184061 RepID=A0AA39V5Q7_9LECA|nr:hypothetical protein JMJ35_004866 [Cladonia borealis]
MITLVAFGGTCKKGDVRHTAQTTREALARRPGEGLGEVEEDEVEDFVGLCEDETNRLSYFLNIHGPSVTIDTACPGSLLCLDMACRTIQSGEADTAIIAASSLYLHPDHVIDRGSVGQTHSATALCHTFDEDADRYVESEAVSCVIIKRLKDAIKDRDPVRVIIRGTVTTSEGRTTGNASLTCFDDTAYLECHGTGTQAGDPTEVNGVGSVFGRSHSTDKPLVIGSIKSNIGHSEPAAGNSGLIKVIMATEQGVIPGTPTFIKPSPAIDFVSNKVKATRTAIPWPDQGFLIRRASINSFGYGGSNAHCIVEQADTVARSNFVSSYRSGEDETEAFCSQEEDTKRPCMCVVSANDATSLQSNIQALCKHLANPRVKVSLPDLAYTLSERRKMFGIARSLRHVLTTSTRRTLLWGPMIDSPPESS